MSQTPAKPAAIKDAWQPPTSMQFVLARREFDVVIQDPGTGRQDAYKMQELDGGGRDMWLNHVAACCDENGRVSQFDGFQAKLIGMCLRNTVDGNLVPGAVIKTWPAHVQAELFRACQSMNGLSDDAEAKSKIVSAGSGSDGTVSPTASV